MPTPARSSVSILLVALLASPASFAFQSPLSDEAVREAYFLGQRHDGSFAHLLDKCSKRLPPPKSGPHISAITLPHALRSARSLLGVLRRKLQCATSRFAPNPSPTQLQHFRLHSFHSV